MVFPCFMFQSLRLAILVLCFESIVSVSAQSNAYGGEGAELPIVMVKYERGFLFAVKQFNYTVEDLTNSINLGQRCEEFVGQHSPTYGIDPLDDDAVKPHALEACRQVIRVSSSCLFLICYRSNSLSLYCIIILIYELILVL